jgi:uncharacterized glyoxalase superfamily protein PhnB
MKPAPKGWQRFSPIIIYEDARSMIDWMCNAFGFEVRLLVEPEPGVVEHSELAYAEGLIMVSQAKHDAHPRFGVPMRGPSIVGGVNTQNVMVFVDDASAHCEHARAAGARIIDEVSITTTATNTGSTAAMARWILRATCGGSANASVAPDA